MARAVRAEGEDVGDLAGESGVSAPDLAVGDDCAAQALAKVEVDEVVQRRLDGGCAFGAGRPVDVVVDQDRAVDDVGQQIDGGELAEQERRVGQVHQPSGGAVHRDRLR